MESAPGVVLYVSAAAIAAVSALILGYLRWRSHGRK